MSIILALHTSALQVSLGVFLESPDQNLPDGLHHHRGSHPVRRHAVPVLAGRPRALDPAQERGARRPSAGYRAAQAPGQPRGHHNHRVLRAVLGAEPGADVGRAGFQGAPHQPAARHAQLVRQPAALHAPERALQEKPAQPVLLPQTSKRRAAIADPSYDAVRCGQDLINLLGREGPSAEDGTC